jgi:hypothetical protein
LQFQLVQQLATALGRGAELLVPQLGDQQLEVATMAPAPDARASASRRANCSATTAARRAISIQKPNPDLSGARKNTLKIAHHHRSG